MGTQAAENPDMGFFITLSKADKKQFAEKYILKYKLITCLPGEFFIIFAHVNMLAFFARN